MVPLIQVFHIVVAHDIQPAGKGLRPLFPEVFRPSVPGVLRLVHAFRELIVQAAPEGADPVADRPGSVQPANLSRQPCRKVVSPVQPAAFRDFVARGPEDHAGMGTVPADKSGQILLPAVREILAVIAAAFGDSPGVKRFVENVHSQAVAGFDQRGGRRIMRRPDRVEARLLQLPDLSCFGFIQGNRAQQTVVVMEASSPQLDGLSIDPESPDGVGGHGPDSEQHLRFVDSLFSVLFEVGPEPAHVPDPDPDPVQVRGFRIPQFRIPYRQGNPGCLPASGAHVNHAFPGSGSLSRAFPDQENLRLGQAVFSGFVADLRLRFKKCAAVRDLPGIRENPVRCDMHPGSVHQEHAAVQPGPGIPPGIGLHARVDVHGNPVFSAERGQARQVDVERRVPVVLQPRSVPVHVHCRVHHRAVKLQSDTVVLPFLRNGEIFCVVAQPAGKVSHIGPGRGVRAYRRGNHSVVRQVHRDSRILLQHARRIQESPPERPVFIDSDAFHQIPSFCSGFRPDGSFTL